MSFTTTPTPQYIDEVEIDSATDSTINLSWSIKGTSHSSQITGFQVHFQKVASSYIQYSAMLSSMTTSYKIRNLVADTFYKVCIVMYRNSTTQGGGVGEGVAQQRQKCMDAGTASWHLPMSVGSSVGAIIALSLIVLMVLIARCPSIMRHRKGGAHTGGKYDSMTSNLHDDHLEMSDTTLHVHEEEEEDEEDNEEGEGEAAAAVAFSDLKGGIIVEVPVTFHEHILKQQQLQQYHHNCQYGLAEGYCNGGNNNKHLRHHLHRQQSLSSPTPPLPHRYLIHRASIPHSHHLTCHQQHQQEPLQQTESISASHTTEYPIPLTYISEAEAGYHIATAAVCPHQAASHIRRTHLKRQVSKGKYEGCVDELPHCSHQHSTIVKIEPQPKLPSSKMEEQSSVEISSPL